MSPPSRSHLFGKKYFFVTPTASSHRASDRQPHKTLSSMEYYESTSMTDSMLSSISVNNTWYKSDIFGYLNGGVTSSCSVAGSFSARSRMLKQVKRSFCRMIDNSTDDLHCHKVVSISIMIY